MASGVERFLVGVKVGNATFEPVVVNAGGGDEVLQRCMAVGAQRHDLLHIALKRGVVALREELQTPAPLLPSFTKGHLRPEQQRRFLVEHPLERLERRFAVGPGLAVAHRDLRRVGKTGFKRCVGLTVDHDDLVAALQQVPRRADADNAGAQNNGFHGAECARHCAQLKAKLNLLQKHQRI